MREEDIAAARKADATDQEIHDTVLIAAAFCMYNRYVDGLATNPRPDVEAYATAAQAVISNGYLGIPA